MSYRFELCDLVMLHKIIHSLVHMDIPTYLHFYSGNSRLRFCHLDRLSLVSDLLPNTTACVSRTTNAFANSYFYRVHILWNKLPLELREVDCPKKFKTLLKCHLFTIIPQLQGDNSLCGAKQQPLGSNLNIWCESPGSIGL